MRLDDFWYVVAESRELTAERPLSRQVLGERLAVFRGADGTPAALQDRCMHRAGALSSGRVRAGCLQCPYHGWRYRPDGTVAEVPSEGPDTREIPARTARCYATAEVDGYVYVRLATGSDAPAEPPRSPHWGAPGWGHIRLQNRFDADVTACVENFIDVPHTVFVHPGIFRTARGQAIDATVTRRGGEVSIDYTGETNNLGWFSWFLNPGRHPIRHTDTFQMPNRTHVVYEMGPRRVFLITSQSVPIDDQQTLVYTDLTYDYGWLTPWVGPVVRWQSQAVIDQDLEVLSRQSWVRRRYGDDFTNTPADVVHVLVESVRAALAAGEDPRQLPDRTHRVRFHA
jgi:phenylpropionate dioxygenase-like ring-hydroxylating dioxygenase large terminal subunit